MYVFAVIAITIIIVLVRAFLDNDSKQDKKMDNTKDEIKENDTTMERNNNVQITNGEVQVEMGTRDLFMRVLMEIGCQYSVNENQEILFAYQGENFIARATNESPFMVIIDPWWYVCELHDVEQFARVKNAINETNARTNVVTYYHVDEDSSNVGVHSDRFFLFIPQIPLLSDYLR